MFLLLVGASLHEKCPFLQDSGACGLRCGAHSANFDEKIKKPQSRSYGRIGADMKLFYNYLMNLNTSISAQRFFGCWLTFESSIVDMQYNIGVIW